MHSPESVLWNLQEGVGRGGSSTAKALSANHTGTTGQAEIARPVKKTNALTSSCDTYKHVSCLDHVQWVLLLHNKDPLPAPVPV